MKPKSILYLVPQVDIPAGGIEAYTRLSWQIFKSYAAARGTEVRCIAFKDGISRGNYFSHRIENGQVLGCNGDKLGFVVRAALCARAYPDSLVVVGHIRQSQVAWLLSKLGWIHSYALLVYGYEAWGKVASWYGLGAHGARAVITISKYTASQFSRHNSVPLSKIAIVPPSLPEVSLVAPPCSDGRSSGVFQVLTVGRLQKGHELKGFDDILRSIARVREAGREIHLSVVGDGDDRLRLQNLARDLGVMVNTTFLGHIPDRKLAEQYKQCDVFVLPSCKEGFGIVFIEAMSFGKPCIGGNHGGTPEIVEHGVTGYLVNHGDIEQLARYLVRLCDSPRLRERLGQKGFKRVRNDYTFPAMKSKWFDVLDKLLEA